MLFLCEMPEKLDRATSMAWFLGHFDLQIQTAFFEAMDKNK